MASWVILPVLSVGGRTPGMSSWPDTMILGGSRCMMGLRAGCGWREYKSRVPSIVDNNAFTVKITHNIMRVNQKSDFDVFKLSTVS